MTQEKRYVVTEKMLDDLAVTAMSFQADLCGETRMADMKRESRSNPIPEGAVPLTREQVEELLCLRSHLTSLQCDPIGGIYDADIEELSTKLEQRLIKLFGKKEGEG